MGLFDVRCAISGLVLRTDEILIFVLLAKTGESHGYVVAPPIEGTYDGYGKLDDTQKSAAFDLVAKNLSTTASFEGKAPKGAKKLIERLTDLDEPPPRLDERELRIAYVSKLVFDALVATGSRSSDISVRLRGKKDAASLYDVALAEHEIARRLGANASGAAEKETRLALIDITRAGIGKEPLPCATIDDREQHDDEAIRAAVALAKKKFAGVREVEDALAAYEKETGSEGDADEDASGTLESLRPALEKALGRSGFAEANGWKKMVTDVPVTLRIEARPDKREIAILIVLDLPTGSVTVSFARRAESMAAAGAEADEIAASLAEKLPAIVQKQRWLAGESASSAELAQAFQADRWFMNDFVSGARSAPSSWLDLVTAMKAMPYTDDVRLAWIKLLSRADCPTDAARALEASTSKSVREAALARIRSGP